MHAVTRVDVLVHASLGMAWNTSLPRNPELVSSDTGFHMQEQPRMLHPVRALAVVCHDITVRLDLRLIHAARGRGPSYCQPVATTLSTLGCRVGRARFRTQRRLTALSMASLSQIMKFVVGIERSLERYRELVAEHESVCEGGDVNRPEHRGWAKGRPREVEDNRPVWAPEAACLLVLGEARGDVLNVVRDVVAESNQACEYATWTRVL